jgi:formylglycine-generating enzyme required for sulfatase activity
MHADAQDEQMIAIGPGEVRLTDRRTRHTWTVELAPYLLAAVPVTQARYAEVTGPCVSLDRMSGERDVPKPEAPAIASPSAPGAQKPPNRPGGRDAPPAESVELGAEAQDQRDASAFLRSAEVKNSKP